MLPPPFSYPYSRFQCLSYFYIYAHFYYLFVLLYMMRYDSLRCLFFTSLYAGFFLCSSRPKRDKNHQLLKYKYKSHGDIHIWFFSICSPLIFQGGIVLCVITIFRNTLNEFCYDKIILLWQCYIIFLRVKDYNWMQVYCWNHIRGIFE